jgi:hypothetical protein
MRNGAENRAEIRSPGERKERQRPIWPVPANAYATVRRTGCPGDTGNTRHGIAPDRRL